MALTDYNMVKGETDWHLKHNDAMTEGDSLLAGKAPSSHTHSGATYNVIGVGNTSGRPAVIAMYTYANNQRYELERLNASGARIDDYFQKTPAKRFAFMAAQLF